MKEFAVAAIGEDRPGIVAEVAGALVEAGVSIEDSSMTILGGHFAMLLLLQGEVGEDMLLGMLTPVAERLGLMLEVRPTTHHVLGGERDDYVIAAYGPDRPGLVVVLARVLGDAGINISDFGSRVGDDGVFYMWFSVSIPGDVDVQAISERLRSAGGEVSLDVSLRRAEVEAL